MKKSSKIFITWLLLDIVIALALIIALVVGASNVAANGPNRQPSNPGSQTGSNTNGDFFVVPELPFGTLMAILASLGAMAGLATKRLKLKH